MSRFPPRTRVSSGFGIAAAPSEPSKAVTTAIRHALAVLPTGTIITGDPVDAGPLWEVPLGNVGTRITDDVTRCVRRRVLGARLELRHDIRTQQFYPVLLIPKRAPAWPGRADYVILLLMAGMVMAFLAVQYRERLWDLRTIIVQREPGEAEEQQ
jgi:hypothetical protein